MSDPRQIAGTQMSASARTQPTVRSAVAEGARRTNTDFEFLLAQARLESGLRPNAKARTSSATGLFQFIESTWLATMKRHGPALGYSDVASVIQKRGNRHYVADPGQRRAIMNLRKDPQIASLMAGALAQDNRNAIAPVLAREPGATELYMAHFLGAGDAKRFLSELYRNPSQSAPALFPRPASANQSIFYHRSGAPRDLAGVMGLMEGKMSRAIAANGRLSPPPPWIEPNTQRLFGDEPISPYGRRAARIVEDAAHPTAGSGPRDPRYDAHTHTPPPISGLPPVPQFGPLQGVPAPSQTNAPAPKETPRPPMSDVLRQSFSLDGRADTNQRSDAATEQVRRAYHDLKAFGL
jgi:hypothetical protein